MVWLCELIFYSLSTPLRFFCFLYVFCWDRPLFHQDITAMYRVLLRNLNYDSVRWMARMVRNGTTYCLPFCNLVPPSLLCKQKNARTATVQREIIKTDLMNDLRVFDSLLPFWHEFAKLMWAKETSTPQSLHIDIHWYSWLWFRNLSSLSRTLGCKRTTFWFCPPRMLTFSD